MSLATRLKLALFQAGITADVSIGDDADKATWKVRPTSLQAAAQPTIDAFDPNAASVVDAELDAAVKHHLDVERLYSAIAWAIIDTYSPPATVAKYQTARTKIISAYRLTPWK